MSERRWAVQLEALANHLNLWAMWGAGIALVLMALHVSFDAFGKYVFSLPVPATLEVVAYYYMPAVAALPMAFVEMKGGHVAIEMLFERLPKLLQRAALIFNGVVMASFIGLLTWLAGREGLRKFEIGEYMFGEYPIIIWPGRFVFTIGLALMALIVLVKLVRVVVGGAPATADASPMQVDAR